MAVVEGINSSNLVICLIVSKLYLKARLEKSRDEKGINYGV